MNSITQDCWLAASYTRLSKEDGDKSESNSIKNQKQLIRDYEETHSEITIVKEYSDDGFSGINFERPDFQSMIEDLKEKKINCIIVKDLSRFGRNYIETGKYLERIFPYLGVRFISINDQYDSIEESNQSKDIVIPFMNLINDTYCRDISIKVRSNLNAKRKKGDYAGAFAPFGYKKSEHNKNKLVIDEPAAKTVRRIFKLKLAGKSNPGIVNILNSEKVLSPNEYKKTTEQGKKFTTSFAVNGSSVWTVQAILRILGNEVYLGHLIQGKRIRPNYKLKDQVEVSREEWIRVEHTHDAIVSQEEFDVVQKLLPLDTRTAPGKKELYTFSGTLYCGKCGEPLLRRSVSSKGEKYTYYGCYSKGRKLRCPGISIREDFIERAVLEALKNHIEILVDINELLTYVDKIPQQQKAVKDTEVQIESRSREADRYRRLKSMLYTSYCERIISQEEYLELKSIYSQEAYELQEIVKKLEQKKENILAGKSESQQFIELFKKYRNIKDLDRRTVLSLISKIDVYSSRKINICFSHQDEFERACSLIRKT